MGYIVEFSMEACVGCGACSVACMDQMDTDISQTPPFRKILTRESVRAGKVKVDYLSLACMHCENPPCVSVCPLDCYYLDTNTGLVILDQSDCIGCNLCGDVCKIGAVAYDRNGKASKCNGCYERVQLQLLPACAKACPSGAIAFRDANQAGLKGGSND
jgi:Fe-S-cluster-containing hydrogenase components 1